MKKLKRVIIVSFLTLIVGNFKVLAFDANNINIVDNEIYFPSIVYLNETNTVGIDNNILNNQSKVYISIIQLTQSQYNNFKTKHDQLSQLSDQYKSDLDALEEEVNELYTAAQSALETYNNETTEENEALFNEAKSNYDTKLDEYNDKVEQLNNLLKQKENEFYEIVPLDESKFNEINKSEENTLTFKTDYDYHYGDFEYGLVWVKVETGDDSYYNFAVVTPEIPKNDSEKVSNEQNEKSSDDNSQKDDINNPNTGVHLYTGIMVIVLSISIVLYMLIRKKSYYRNVSNN